MKSTNTNQNKDNKKRKLVSIVLNWLSSLASTVLLRSVSKIFHTFFLKVQINALCLFLSYSACLQILIVRFFLIVNLFKNQEPEMLFIFHCNLLTFDYVLCFFFMFFLNNIS